MAVNPAELSTVRAAPAVAAALVAPAVGGTGRGLAAAALGAPVVGGVGRLSSSSTSGAGGSRSGGGDWQRRQPSAIYRSVSSCGSLYGANSYQHVHLLRLKSHVEATQSCPGGGVAWRSGGGRARTWWWRRWRWWRSRSRSSSSRSKSRRNSSGSGAVA